MVAWETVETNDSQLNYSVSEVINGTNNWKPSTALLLNETNMLENQNLALVAGIQGQVVAVWQKKQMTGTDDTDLYYNILNISSNVLNQSISNNVIDDAPRVSEHSPRDSTSCVAIGVDLANFTVPASIPLLGGHYDVGFSGEACGNNDCMGTSRSVSASGQFATPHRSFDVNFELSASWKNVQCQYVFDTAGLAVTGNASEDIPAIAFSFKPFGWGVLGASLGASVGASGEWRGVNWPNWPPQSASVSVKLQGGPYGKFYINLPWGGTVEARVSGTGSLGAQFNYPPPWVLTVDVQLEAEVHAGPFNISWHQDWSDEENLADFKPHYVRDDLDSGLVITLSPSVGTTNVYSGNPVLTDVGSNMTDDGRPSLIVTPSGVTFLAWTLDSATPDLWLGSSVLVSTLQSNGWSVPVEIPGSRGFNSDVTITFDSQGRPLVVWSMASNAGLSLSNSVDQVVAAMGSNQVVYALYNGTSWSAPDAVAMSTGGNGRVALLQATNGTVVAAWLKYVPGTNATSSNTIFTAQWNGLVWSPTSSVPTGQIVGNIGLGLVSGQPNMFWSEDFNQDTKAPDAVSIVYSTYDMMSGNWAIPQIFTAGDDFTKSSVRRLEAPLRRRALILTRAIPRRIVA